MQTHNVKRPYAHRAVMLAAEAQKQSLPGRCVLPLLSHWLPALLRRCLDTGPSLALLSRCAGGEAGQRRTMQLHTLQRGEQLWIAAGVVHKNCSCLLQKRPGCMLQDGKVVAKGSVKGAWSMPEGAEVELAGWELEIEASMHAERFR